jgi:nicotinic acid mononucleotide adenylyltransferase
MIGVYWGAFDPPTKAHQAIICTSLTNIPLKKLMVIVNNNIYKKYSYPLDVRIKWLEQLIHSNGLKNVAVIWQDENHKMDYAALKELFEEPLCAIAGYDAYQTWLNFSTLEERSAYQAIAVIPRGDAQPTLYDKNAFLLPIDPIYKYVSSSQAK